MKCSFQMSVLGFIMTLLIYFLYATDMHACKFMRKGIKEADHDFQITQPKSSPLPFPHVLFFEFDGRTSKQERTFFAECYKKMRLNYNEKVGK